MRIIKCSNAANEFVKAITSSAFVNLDPVIAGGFAIWLYETSMFNPNRMNVLLENYLQSCRIQQINIITGNMIDVNGSYGLVDHIYFNDVDSWFLSDNDIWNSSNKYNRIVKSVEYKEDIKSLGMELGFHNLQYQSMWANTFSKHSRISVYKDNIQIILKEYDSVYEVLNTFDLNGCKIAWHKENFYIHDDFFSAMNAGEIQLNSTNWNSSEYFQKVQSGIRAFKYHKRTGMPLSKDSIDKLFELYQDVLDHDLTKSKLLSNSKVGGVLNNLYSNILSKINPAASSAITSYSPKANSSDLLTIQHTKFLNEFPWFVSQKHFDPAMLTYFIDSKYMLIDRMVSAEMDYASRVKKAQAKINIDLDFDELF